MGARNREVTFGPRVPGREAGRPGVTGPPSYGRRVGPLPEGGRRPAFPVSREATGERGARNDQRGSGKISGPSPAARAAGPRRAGPRRSRRGPVRRRGGYRRPRPADPARPGDAVSCAPECDNARTAVGIALQLARGHDEQAQALAADAPLIRDVVWHQIRLAYAMSMRRGRDVESLEIRFRYEDYTAAYQSHLYLANAVLADADILDGLTDELTTCVAYPLGAFLISVAVPLD